MDDFDNASLGVGFDIDAAGSFETLARLDSAIDRATANAIEEFNRVERASAGMLNLNGAQTTMRAFGAETTQAARAAARELASVEKAGEKLVSQIERQSAAFGKSREELRLAKVEMQAMAAEQQGLTELAGRLRTAQSELAAKELAAAERIRRDAEAAAEDKALAEAQAAIAAAQERVRAEAALNAQLLERSRVQAALDRTMGGDRPRATDAGATFSALAARAAEEEEQALRSATRAYELFESRVRAGLSTLREQEAAERAAGQARQASINSAEAYAQKLEQEAEAIGKTALELRELEFARRAADADRAGLGDQAARIRAAGAAYAEAATQAAALAEEERRLAAAEREAAAAQVAQDANLHSLRSSVDPLFAAQQRLSRELENAARLYRAGAIGQDEYASSSTTLAQRLDEVQRAQARAAEGADDVADRGRLKANDLTNIMFQVQDIIVSLQGGQKPLTVLIQQGSQLGGIMMQTGASFGDMVRAVAGLAIVSRPSAAASAALAEAEAARAAAHSAATTAGARAAITAAELAVAEEAATRAGLSDVAAQNALALARHEAAAAAEVAAAANRRLAASQATATASAEAAAASASRSLAPWLSTSLAVAAPLAVATVAFKRWQDEVSDDAGLKAYAASLGLTHREMKKLGDVSVTAGDVLKGLGKTLNDSLDINISGKSIMDALFSPDDAKQVQTFVSQIYGVFVGGYHAIVELWSEIAPAIGAFVSSAAKAAAAFFKPMVDAAKWAGAAVMGLFQSVYQWVADKLKFLGAAVSPILRAIGSSDAAAALDGAGQKMGQRFSGAFAAAAAPLGRIGNRLGEAFGQAYSKAAGDFVTGTNHFVAKVGENATEAARKRLKTKADEILADRVPKTDRHAESLAREAEAIEAQIRNLYKLADAYTISGAAALIAEARVKAESDAIKKRGDIEAMVDRQIRLSIAQRVSDSSKATAGLRDQAVAQEQVNAMVAAGAIPAARASELMQAQIADLPLLAALQAAQQRGLAMEAERATGALAAQRAERERLNIATRGTAFQSAQAEGANRLAEVQEELRLVQATDAARVHALATLRATQEAEKFNPEDRAVYINQQVAIAANQQQLQLLTTAYNDSLRYQADLFDAIATNVQAAGRGIAEAFGEAGRALGDMATVFAGHLADQQRLIDWQQIQLRNAGQIKDVEARARKEREITTLYAIRSGALQIGVFGDLAASAKGFFDQGSTGYQALASAEKAFRAVQFALSVRAIAQDAIETGSAIAKSGARAAAHAVEAVAKAIAGLPFPLNIAAGAATAGVLASIGLSIAGAFGGGGGKLPEANAGTGTVLGDSAAKSESLKRSLDALKEVDTITSVYAREMATSLRSIDNQIGGLASVLVRAGNINASAGITEGFKTDMTGKLLSSVVDPLGILSKIPVIGGLFSGLKGLIGSLFGSTTTVIGNGLYGGAQSLGGILSGGFDASYYSDVEKKKRFLGITTGKSYSTQYTGADAGLENQFTLILREFNNAIVAAAGPLGAATGDIQNRLNGFVVDIGKIDLKGLTGAQIQEKLTAVFGAAADRMADSAFPGFQRFAKVGEGAFETLVRVASTVEAATNALNDLGGAASALGIDAKMGLVAQFDSVSAFTSATDAYFQGYYSKAEQSAAKTAQLGKVFDSLGLSMPSSLSAFRSLVEAQNLTTTAGQATYATLLKLAPAFADLQAALEGAKSAADIASERADLERKLLEVNGDTAALRALDLAKLDASNRALQTQIWAIQDAQEAAKAADELRKAWAGVGDSIMEEVKRIRGLTDAGGGGSFAVIMGQFNAANTAARGGDQDAAKLLPGLSQSLLTAAGNAATSRQELDRIRAQTAAQLEATWAAIQGRSTAPVTGTGARNPAMTAIDYAQTVQQAAAPANDDLVAELRSLRDEVAQLRSENNAGHAATAGNTGAVKRVLENVSAPNGGQALSVAGAA